MKVFVQFSDLAQTVVCSVFGNPQDPIAFPNQATIDDTDARYQAFINPVSVVDQMWAKIKAFRDNRVQTGGYQAAGKWFDSDTFSRSQQLGLVLMGSNIPNGLQWKTMDGTFITMTQTLAGQIFAAAAAQDQATFAQAEVHNVAMRASANPSTYDFSGGWPVIYEG